MLQIIAIALSIACILLTIRLASLTLGRRSFRKLELISCVGYKCLKKHDCSKTWCEYTSPDGKFRGNLSQCYERHIFQKQLQRFSLEPPQEVPLPKAGTLWEEETKTPENSRR